MTKKKRSSMYGEVIGTTPEDRQAFVEKQRADRVKYGNLPPGLIPGGHGMDFIDATGRVIHPTREAYEDFKQHHPLKKVSGGYNGKHTGKRRHYYSSAIEEDAGPRHSYSGLVRGLEVFVSAFGILGGLFFFIS